MRESEGGLEEDGQVDRPAQVGNRKQPQRDKGLKEGQGQDGRDELLDAAQNQRVPELLVRAQ